MSGLFPELDGHWLSVSGSDSRAVALYRRHYSVKVKAYWPGRSMQGPGEKLTLLTADGLALFAWRLERLRKDGQEGVTCTIFRNEGPILSSLLIREACDIAWRRWPATRLFTYVWDAKVRSSNPGACFKKAGWKRCGRNADGRLTILEMLPEWGAEVAT